MMSLLLAALLTQGPIVGGPEPRAASPWTQSVRASCGTDAIAIDGYGAGRPADAAPTLRVNDRPVAGEVGPLLADLSHRSAVYRLQILCSAAGGTTLRIDEGEKQPDGSVRYRSGSALVRGDRLISYTGLQDGNAESFWFR